MIKKLRLGNENGGLGKKTLFRKWSQLYSNCKDLLKCSIFVESRK